METLTFRIENLVKSRQEVMEDFEGPLDLILDLLKRQKIDIQDLRISLLLEQYLAWMEARKRLDLEIASEFIAMASHLVYLKTKVILSLGQPEEDEEVDELILALRERVRQEEYAHIRAASAFLRERMDIGRGMFTRAAEQLAVARTYAFSHDKADIIRAIEDIGIRAVRKTPPPVEVFKRIVAPEKHPVQDKITSILSHLRERGKAVLRALLGGKSRSESVASFLAILELCRMRRISLSENGDDYDIQLRPEE
ncbi:MAG: segregation/condensation protein A [Oscillospiraceae bacterium]|jgi:segregation and condensation protein A|nr:segregation/condensation protein A [Oscillospiraceae bacterium]